MTRPSSEPRQWLAASGYLSIFLMPILLALGSTANRPLLAFGTAVLAFPLLRSVFGSWQQEHQFLWCERVSTALHTLPVIYALVAPVCFVLVLVHTGHGGQGFSEHVWLGLSLWMTMLFGLCPAHELLHRRAGHDVVLGALLAGLVGYPAMAYEHLPHHARHGNTLMAEWPCTNESVWHFASRRLRRIAWDIAHELTCVSIAAFESRSLRLVVYAHAMTLAAIGFAFWLAGWPGLVIYAIAACGCAVGMQIITFVQHWGVADPHFARGRAQPIAWEEDCRFQSWVTLHISFHQAHHLRQDLPYYRLGLVPGSPRLPAGYLVMMIVSLFPALWRRIMMPVLERWRVEPFVAWSAGRRLTCFSRFSGQRVQQPRERSRAADF